MIKDLDKRLVWLLHSENTHSGSSGGFVNARKTQFTKIVRMIKISKYLNRVKEFNAKNESTRHESDLT